MLYSLQRGIALNRYERQMQIAEWSDESQRRLSEAHVTVVGAGGLGSPVLYYLAAAGVGRIHLIDNDTVHISNLNRQILYTEQDIYKMKAEVAAQRLSTFNTAVKTSYA